jgi:hypothetical protein
MNKESEWVWLKADTESVNDITDKYKCYFLLIHICMSSY